MFHWIWILFTSHGPAGTILGSIAAFATFIATILKIIETIGNVRKPKPQPSLHQITEVTLKPYELPARPTVATLATIGLAAGVGAAVGEIAAESLAHHSDAAEGLGAAAEHHDSITTVLEHFGDYI